MTFIEKLTEHLIIHYKEDIKDICIVLPNRRAGLYLKRHIPLFLKKTTFAPDIFSIEDFVCHITGIGIADSLTLLTELYKAYTCIEKENAQTFDDFMNWGEILITDYNDCDINLADAVKIFKLLNEAKAISLWNLEQQPLTDHEQKYLHFYNSLSTYYPGFVSRLLKSKFAYQGLIYRKAAEHIKEYISSCTYRKIVFAGFNALTLSEEKIMKSLLEGGKAEILWDSDKYYSENKNHEAGHFIRKYKKEWDIKDFRWEEDNFHTIQKQIFITGVPLNIGQAEVAGQVLSGMDEHEINSEKTALVLADESLLSPVLYSIPENIYDINITMGFPLAQTTAYNLFDYMFSMYVNALKFGHSKNLRFYYKDLIKVLNHPYCKLLINKSDDNGHDPVHDLFSANRIFFTYEDITKYLGTCDLNILFIAPDSLTSQLPLQFIKLINAIRKAMIAKKSEDTGLDMEHLFHFAGIMNRLKTFAEDPGLITELKTLHALFKNISSSASLPFSGEPLKGLQVMGLLETRSLDFDNLIILSVNENILPTGKHTNTFIPFDIRNAEGLSTYKQNESIFAYHFYRLLQRAKNVHIVYNSQADKFGSGEKSRFITQLIEELPKYNSLCKIQNQILINKVHLSEKTNEIQIIKTPEILDALKKIATHGFSPTALNTYIACPLKFYFSYVEGIKESEDVEETIDAATLGTVVHSVLKELYKDHVNSPVGENDIRKMMTQSAARCEEAFRIHYPEGDIRFGKNLLISKVALKLIQNFLNTEINFVKTIQAKKTKLTILHLEQKFTGNLPEIEIGHEKIRPCIKGSIDRIDEVGRTIRIIDYKTGTIHNSELNIETFENLTDDPGRSKSVQLLCYALSYCDETKTEQVTAGLISLRRPGEGFMPVRMTNKTETIDTEILNHFKTVITKRISEILNENKPFQQTASLDNCKNCAFITICNR